MNLKARFRILVRFCLAVVFLYAAFAKAKQFEAPETVSNSIFQEWAGSIWLRCSLICGEALLAMWLASGIEVGMAGMGTLVILSAFSGLIVVQLAQEYPKPCGCMGSQVNSILNPNAIRLSLQRDLTRNVLMMIGAAWLYFSATPQKRFAKPFDTKGSPTQVAQKTELRCSICRDGTLTS
jgi:hypothetical protein